MQEYSNWSVSSHEIPISSTASIKNKNVSEGVFEIPVFLIRKFISFSYFFINSVNEQKIGIICVSLYFCSDA